LRLVERIEDAPVCKHHFEADNKVARDPIGECAGAAGIGGEIAADRATALGAERKRKQAVGLGGRSLRFASTTPASQVMVSYRTSTSRMRSSRLSDNTTSP